MISLFGSEADIDRRRAGIVRLRVGLALIGDARRGGGFETDPATLAARVGEILGSLRAAGLNPDDVRVEAEPIDRERVRLSTPTGEDGSSVTVLSADGVVLEQFSTYGADPEEDDDEEVAAEAEETAAPRLVGGRFLRALVPDPQPGAAVRVLAVELFGDGLVAHFSFDQTREEFERRLAEDPFDEAESPSVLRVEDDLGTEYHRGAGGAGAATGGVRSWWEFAPAVPDEARLLRVTTNSGSVAVEVKAPGVGRQSAG